MTSTRFDSFRLKVLCIALVAIYPALVHAGVAGRVQFVAGDVRIVDAQGKGQALRKGQDVNEGDTVMSAASASAQLKMIDGAVVAVRPGTQLKIVGYQFNGKEDGSERASYSLIKGGLRAITGMIGKTNKDRYSIETPTAVIGIRGTDHEPVVVLPVADGDVTGAAPGTYDKVNVGATSLTTQAGTMVVAANQVGFAASPTQLPVILPVVPDFYSRTPVSQAAQGQQDQQEQKEQQEQNPEQASSQVGSDDTAATEAQADAVATTATSSTKALSAVDANGNNLDLTRQTITSANGQVRSLTEDNVVIPPTLPPTFPPEAGVLLMASYPAPAEDSGDGVPLEAEFRYSAAYFADGRNENLTRDAAGNVTSASNVNHRFFEFDHRSSLSQSGSTMTDLGKHEATGLSWGRWQGGKVTESSQYFDMDASGAWGMGASNDNGEFIIGNVDTRSTDLGSGSLHWIAGSSVGQGFLSRVLTGTANYTSIGGTNPTDTKGNVGTFTNASLGVNFTTRTANADVNFSIAGDSWNMRSDTMQLQDAHFSSHNNCQSTCASTVQLTRNGTILSEFATADGGGFGSISGMLVGSGLNGAALQYVVQTHAPKSGIDPETGLPYRAIDHNLIQGAAALAGPTQDVDTPFRVVNVNSDWELDMDDDDVDDGTVGTDGKPLYRGSVDGEVARPAQIVDNAGGLIQFAGSTSGYVALGSTAPFALDRDTEATIKIGSAVNRDVGSTTIAGATISWGRWEGGTVDIYSSDGTVKLGTIDNSNRSMHWLASSTLTNQYFNMPLTGTATYTVAGNTSPTDLIGNAGTLTAATLTADFANAKVNAGVSVNFNTQSNTSTWNMAATNIPLAGDGEFNSSSLLNGVNGITHTATCAGPSCGAQTIGHIDGHFVGGAQGAVLSYNMGTGNPASTEQNVTPLNAVSGVVVMKR